MVVLGADRAVVLVAAASLVEVAVFRRAVGAAGRVVGRSGVVVAFGGCGSATGSDDLS